MQSSITKFNSSSCISNGHAMQLNQLSASSASFSRQNNQIKQHKIAGCGL